MVTLGHQQTLEIMLLSPLWQHWPPQRPKVGSVNWMCGVMTPDSQQIMDSECCKMAKNFSSCQVQAGGKQTIHNVRLSHEVQLWGLMRLDVDNQAKSLWSRCLSYASGGLGVNITHQSNHMKSRSWSFFGGNEPTRGGFPCVRPIVI